MLIPCGFLLLYFKVRSLNLALVVNISSWPPVSYLKMEKVFLGKPFIYMYGKPSGPSGRRPLSRLKVIFLIFHTSLPPMQLTSHGCFGKSLKKGSPSAGQTAFLPIGNISTAFFGKCGCSPSVRCYFLSAEWAIFPCCFSYIWQSTDE